METTVLKSATISAITSVKSASTILDLENRLDELGD